MRFGLIAIIAHIINDLLDGNPLYESLLKRRFSQLPSPLLKSKTTFEFPVTAESLLGGLMVRNFN